MAHLAICLASVCVLVFPASADAGAWTKRKYEGLLIAGLGAHWLDPHARPASLGTIKLEASLYAEFGLTDRITLVGRGGYQQVFDRRQPLKKALPPPRAGFGGLALGARVGLVGRGRWASSLQVMAGIPGSGENWINEAFGARGGDLDLRLQLGRSIGGHGFVAVSTGARFRGEGVANEARLDISAGCDFVFNTRVMVQSYSVWALGGNPAQPAYSGHRLQVSLLLPVGQANSVQLSVLRTMNQQRMSDEFAVMASVWRSF